MVYSWKSKYLIWIIAVVILNLNISNIVLGISSTDNREINGAENIFYQIITPKNDLNGIIIMNHGLSLDRAYMQHYADLFSTQGFHVVLIDAPNHGYSRGNLTFGIYETHLNVQILNEVSTKLSRNWDHVGLLGFSMGGYTALRTQLYFNSTFNFTIVVSPAVNWSAVKISQEDILRYAAAGTELPPPLNPVDFISIANKIICFTGSADEVVEPMIMRNFCQAANITDIQNGGMHSQMLVGNENFMAQFVTNQTLHTMTYSFWTTYAHYITFGLVVLILIITTLAYFIYEKRKKQPQENEQPDTISTILLLAFGFSLSRFFLTSNIAVHPLSMVYLLPFELLIYLSSFIWIVCSQLLVIKYLRSKILKTIINLSYLVAAYFILPIAGAIAFHVISIFLLLLPVKLFSFDFKWKNKMAVTIVPIFIISILIL